MKIELKDFQHEAVERLFTQLTRARQEVREGTDQALVLSSPTGSGKTAMMTALIEHVIEGYGDAPADEKAIFLWLSDSPELNEQSRKKILETSSVLTELGVEVIGPEFEQADFRRPPQQSITAPQLFFLNIQKLGQDKRLVSRGDHRATTIWETIDNTIANGPDSFYLVIDEAHRGMGTSGFASTEAATIVQKFLFGEPGVMKPVPLVIGMTATPARFQERLRGAMRTFRPTDVLPERVRESGLIKERIVVHIPTRGESADWTLLEEATREWLRFRREWKDAGVGRSIEPILVVQVRDGNKRTPSTTELETVVEVLERVAGDLPPQAIRHCMHELYNLEIGKRVVTRIDASEIDGNPDVQIVLFKTSLTTGWDCPRAEVMMSFRSAKDHTHIAQLVGRMVRAPLAEKIEGNDFLNSVSLYLPHYDRENVKQVIQRLQDPEYQTPTDVELSSEIDEWAVPDAMAPIVETLNGLPTYRVHRGKRLSGIERLMALGRLLTLDELDQTAWPKAKQFVVDQLRDELRDAESDPAFVDAMSRIETIDVSAISVLGDTWSESDVEQTTVRRVSENVDALFEWCGRKLGEGLHRTFWREEFTRAGNAAEVKLKLYVLLTRPDSLQRVNDACKHELNDWMHAQRDAIEDLPRSNRQEYLKIRLLAEEPEPLPLTLPAEMIHKVDGDYFDRHLYEPKTKQALFQLNEWEKLVLNKEMERADFVAWFRNPPRRDWAFAIPYTMDGQVRPLYPDFLSVRSVNGEPAVDILEPHNITFQDSVSKIVGLARYAREHGHHFGRIEFIVVEGQSLRRLDVNVETVRESVLRVETAHHLREVLDRYAPRT